MNQTSGFFRALVSACLLLLLAQPRVSLGVDAPVAMDQVSVDTTGQNQAVFPWGVPQFSDGVLNTYPRPAWVRAAVRDGGFWVTNDTWYGWQPGLDDEAVNLATNRLLIQIDRAFVTNNLWIAVAASVDLDAMLLAGFYDQDLHAVAGPITLHVSDATPWFTNRIDLAQFPSASIISLFASNGLTRIYCSALCLEGGAVVLNVPAEPPSAHPPANCLPPAANSVASLTPGFNTAGKTAPSRTAPGSNPAGLAVPQALHARQTWYVDGTAGDDLRNDGKAAVSVLATSTGPKKTIAAVLNVAKRGDAICIAAGVYPEHVYLGGVRLITQGRVILQ